MVTAAFCAGKSRDLAFQAEGACAGAAAHLGSTDLQMSLSFKAADFRGSVCFRAIRAGLGSPGCPASQAGEKETSPTGHCSYESA